MPESKLRRIAALGALVLATVTLALAAGSSAFAATGKPVTGTKGASGKAGKTGKTGKVGKFVRPVGGDGNEHGDDDAPEWNGGSPPEDPPTNNHFGW